MAEIRFISHNLGTGNESSIPIASSKNEGDIERKFLLKKSLQKEEKKEQQKISTEDLMKSLMKPKEIKRLLYLAVPFTRHLIAELDQNKGLFIDKES